MNKTYLLIGGNLGKRFENIAQAEKMLSEKVGKIIFSSAIYETAPWGFVHENYFLNKILCIETILNANEILECCLETEKKLGRNRNLEKFSARTMDIDILFYNDEIIKTEKLTVPHPQMQFRKFVLVPLAEIAGNFHHPALQKNIFSLLRECKDILDVKML